jgi:hypothetical protein
MAERCADIMKLADPGADIDITKSEAAATSLTTILAHVEGMRADTPPRLPAPRKLAVECRFDDGILTGFRWTAGPTPGATPAPTPGATPAPTPGATPAPTH